MEKKGGHSTTRCTCFITVSAKMTNSFIQKNRDKREAKIHVRFTNLCPRRYWCTTFLCMWAAIMGEITQNSRITNLVITDFHLQQIAERKADHEVREGRNQWGTWLSCTRAALKTNCPCACYRTSFIRNVSWLSLMGFLRIICQSPAFKNI